MKNLFLLGAMVCALGMMTACKNGTISEDTTSPCADTTLECHPLFDSLEYNDDGIAFIKNLTIEVNGGGRYDFDKDAPVYAGKYAGTAIAFDYCGEHYYIPVDEKIAIGFSQEFPFTAFVTIQVWRDYAEYRYDDKGKTECGPFALITSYQLK